MSSEKKYPIHLPKTSFPMKGNLSQTWKTQVEFWNKNKIYKKIQEQSRKNPLFTFIDGPPYANGRIHLGTALNKVLKDILVKQAHLFKKRCAFVPIWDCHGLPIELRALKKIKTRKPCEVRQACRKEASHWVDKQKQQFESLGVLADWEQKLLTMDYRYEAEEVRLLAELVEKGLIYRGKRPIHWCTKLRTATAVSEVEYKDHTSPSIDVKLKAESDLFPKNTFFIIWTTTPWTLPANEAICLNADLEYGLFKVSSLDEHWVLAKELQESLENRANVSLDLVKTFKGKDLANQAYSHPFQDDRKRPVILGSHVTLETGTGCVHTAPGHGIEDFVVGSQYKLPCPCPVDEAGKFTEDVPFLKGLHVFEGNKEVVKKLKETSHLVHHEEIQHSYPYNPRSKSPLIFRITSQWFLKVDHPKQSVKKKALSLIENQIQFVPENTRQRLQSMIQESPDWCLSRQRIWGVPIVVFYCESCEQPLVNKKVILQIADQMEKTKRGIDYYFTSPVEKLLPKNTKCDKCKGGQFKKGEDILDVWFDSGVCHTVFSKLYGSEYFPSDVYLEGSDQHRGWFQTSLHSSVALHNKTPFKTLITHGFVYDLEKKKMSKSAGNIIDPEDIIKKHGSEILRLWVAASDYSQDISSGEEVLSRLIETYRRFRNTIRFLIGNIHDFDPKKDALSPEKMLLLDQWILSLLTELSTNIKKYYETYQFHKVHHELNKFFTTRLSSLYLDIIKDRLYTFKKDGLERKSAQTALYLLLKNLLQLMSPITSFLSEEAYRYLPGDLKESIFLALFEEPTFRSKELEEKIETWLEIRHIVSKKIEELRNNKIVGSSLEVDVMLTLPLATYKTMNSKLNLKEFFIVSNVQVEQGDSLQIKVAQAQGDKCVRCWCIDENLNSEKLCSKCITNIS